MFCPSLDCSRLCGDLELLPSGTIPVKVGEGHGMLSTRGPTKVCVRVSVRAFLLRWVDTSAVTADGGFMEHVWVNKAQRCAHSPAVRSGYLCGRVRGLPLRCDLKPTHPLGGAGISGAALIVCVTHLEGFFRCDRVCKAHHIISYPPMVSDQMCRSSADEDGC